MSFLLDQLQQLILLNETKGQELIVLGQLPEFRQQAESEQDWPMIAQSYWQEHLAHQHLVMNNQDPDNSHRLAMLVCAQSAHQVITNHNLDQLLGASHRFLGRAYTYQNQHDQAKVEYETAIELLRKASDIRYLEVTGFLCESLIRSNQINEGLVLAYSTFDAYDTDPLAQTLQKVDPHTFIVWRSGIFPRLITTLEELKLDYDKVKVKKYLQKSQVILNNNPQYNYRLAEIKKTLSTLGTFLLSFIHLQSLNHFKIF
ncbi:MAG: hypothetical protein WAV41_02825 [Microgenomates group bacterium]